MNNQVNDTGSVGTLQTGIFRIQLKILHKNTTLNLKKSKYFDRAKIKKLFVSFVSCTRPSISPMGR
jgi:hypothetical protein